MSLAVFTDFMASTGPLYLTSARDVVNDAVKTNYNTLSQMLRDQSDSAVLQGGKTIDDIIYLSAVRRSRTYKPNQPQSYTMPQTETNWSIPWRFVITDMTWTDEEVTLQAGGKDTNAQFDVYKNLKHQKERDMWTDALNHIDDLLWAVPDTTQMETQSTGQEPYSIPAFVNEHANGLFPSYTTGGAWTTVQGINPTSAGKTTWKPQAFTYTNLTAGSVLNLINGFVRAFLKTDFRPPPIKKEFFEGAPVAPRRWIATSMTGKANLIALMQASNDRWESTSDPATGFMETKFAGIPVVYVAALETAALYANAGATALVAETAADITGPRYYGLNSEYLRPVFHTDRYFHNLGVLRDPAQPTTFIMPVNTYFNLACRSRQRHFILSPSADL